MATTTPILNITKSGDHITLSAVATLREVRDAIDVLMGDDVRPRSQASAPAAGRPSYATSPHDPADEMIRELDEEVEKAKAALAERDGRISDLLEQIRHYAETEANLRRELDELGEAYESAMTENQRLAEEIEERKKRPLSYGLTPDTDPHSISKPGEPLAYGAGAKLETHDNGVVTIVDETPGEHAICENSAGGVVIVDYKAERYQLATGEEVLVRKVDDETLMIEDLDGRTLGTIETDGEDWIAQRQGGESGPLMKKQDEAIAWVVGAAATYKSTVAEATIEAAPVDDSEPRRPADEGDVTLVKHPSDATYKADDRVLLHWRPGYLLTPATIKGMNASGRYVLEYEVGVGGRYLATAHERDLSPDDGFENPSWPDGVERTHYYAWKEAEKARGGRLLDPFEYKRQLDAGIADREATPANHVALFNAPEPNAGKLIKDAEPEVLTAPNGKMLRLVAVTTVDGETWAGRVITPKKRTVARIAELTDGTWRATATDSQGGGALATAGVAGTREDMLAWVYAYSGYDGDEKAAPSALADTKAEDGDVAPKQAKAKRKGKEKEADGFAVVAERLRAGEYKDGDGAIAYGAAELPVADLKRIAVAEVGLDRDLVDTAIADVHRGQEFDPTLVVSTQEFVHAYVRAYSSAESLAAIAAAEAAPEEVRQRIAANVYQAGDGVLAFGDEAMKVRLLQGASRRLGFEVLDSNMARYNLAGYGTDDKHILSTEDYLRALITFRASRTPALARRRFEEGKVQAGDGELLLGEENMLRADARRALEGLGCDPLTLEQVMKHCFGPIYGQTRDGEVYVGSTTRILEGAAKFLAMRQAHADVVGDVTFYLDKWPEATYGDKYTVHVFVDGVKNYDLGPVLGGISRAVVLERLEQLRERFPGMEELDEASRPEVANHGDHTFVTVAEILGSADEVAEKAEAAPKGYDVAADVAARLRAQEGNTMPGDGEIIFGAERVPLETLKSVAVDKMLLDAGLLDDAIALAYHNPTDVPALDVDAVLYNYGDLLRERQQAPETVAEVQDMEGLGEGPYSDEPEAEATVMENESDDTVATESQPEASGRAAYERVSNPAGADLRLYAEAPTDDAFKASASLTRFDASQTPASVLVGRIHERKADGLWVGEMPKPDGGRVVDVVNTREAAIALVIQWGGFSNAKPAAEAKVDEKAFSVFYSTPDGRIATGQGRIVGAGVVEILRDNGDKIQVDDWRVRQFPETVSVLEFEAWRQQARGQRATVDPFEYKRQRDAGLLTAPAPEPEPVAEKPAPVEEDRPLNDHERIGLWNTAEKLGISYADYKALVLKHCGAEETHTLRLSDHKLLLEDVLPKARKAEPVKA